MRPLWTPGRGSSLWEERTWTADQTAAPPPRVVSFLGLLSVASTQETGGAVSTETEISENLGGTWLAHNGK